MKKYIFAAVLSLVLLASPTFTQAASLTSAQISAIVSLLQSFGADQTTINNVQISLNGGTTTPQPSSAFCYNFNSNLTVGNIGEGPSALNTALNLNGLTPSDFHSSTFTEDTATYVIAFQAKYGIRQTGYVGPITRAKLNALYGCSSLMITTTSPLPNAKVGQSYSVTLNTSGSTGSSYSWSVDNGAAGFPVTGLGFSDQSYGNSNRITGIPAKVYVAGVEQMVPYTFTFNITVSSGSQTVTKQFTLTVDPTTTTQPTITILSPNGGEHWALGSDQTLTWNSQNMGTSRVRIV